MMLYHIVRILVHPLVTLIVKNDVPFYPGRRDPQMISCGNEGKYTHINPIIFPNQFFIPDFGK